MIASYQSLSYSFFRNFDAMKSEIRTHRTRTTTTTAAATTTMMKKWYFYTCSRRSERKVLFQKYARRA